MLKKPDPIYIKPYFFECGVTLLPQLRFLHRDGFGVLVRVTIDFIIIILHHCHRNRLKNIQFHTNIDPITPDLQQPDLLALSPLPVAPLRPGVP